MCGKPGVTITDKSWSQWGFSYLSSVLLYFTLFNFYVGFFFVQVCKLIFSGLNKWICDIEKGLGWWAR
ncbi:hypothetical protein Hanom_Chr12g01146681 [Helianthus anomalus]